MAATVPVTSICTGTARYCTRTVLTITAGLEAEAALVVWELGEDASYRQVAKAVGDEQVVLTQPYPVTIVPADLVR